MDMANRAFSYIGMALLSTGLLSSCTAGPWPLGYEGQRAMGYGGVAQYRDVRIGIPGLMGSYDDYEAWILNLSEEQYRQIAQIRQRLSLDFDRRRGDWLAARDALQAQLNAPDPDAEAVAAAYDRMAVLERELLQAQVQAHNRIRAVLTEEQRAQMPRMTAGIVW